MMAKFKTTIALFLFLSAVTATGFGAVAAAGGTRVALCIDRKLEFSCPACHPRADFSLADVLISHARYLLRDRGYSISVFDLPAREREMVVARSLCESGFDRVLIMEPGSDFETRTMVIQDYRRVRRLSDVEGCFALDLDCRSYVPEGNSVRLMEDITLRERTRPDWLDVAREGPSRQLDSVAATTAEPLEYVVQRALDRALAGIPRIETSADPGGFAFPTVVYVDSSYINATNDDWRGNIRITLDVASQALNEQFGYSLALADMRSIVIGMDDDRSLEDVFRGLKSRLPLDRDTLTVVVYDYVARNGSFLEQHTEKIGLTEIGRRLILLDGVPVIHSRDPKWQAIGNGLTLLHEIGHAFGAIHVSDINSIMNHNVTWQATDRFDPINARIVEAGLSGALSFFEPAEYIRFVTEVISSEEYGLADYPAFLDLYLGYGGNNFMKEELRRAVSRSSYLTALRGHRQILSGDLAGAASSFKLALKGDPHQASLYYYLSLVTQGKDSEQARQRAVDFGYYRAMILPSDPGGDIKP